MQITQCNSEDNNKPIIGVIMGSLSDNPIMSECCKILDKFDVNYEVHIVSAHRTPQLMYDYATSAKDKGIKVIIAGAGGAAHLPGMCASLTNVPVIGVPIKTSTLSGMDSLYPCKPGRSVRRPGLRRLHHRNLPRRCFPACLWHPGSL